MADYALARRNMIEAQLRANGVTEPEITSAFAAVPREQFVPAALRSIAYLDEDLALTSGRYLMEPMVFGKLVHLAQVKPSDNVLHVCAGCGYGSAVLSKLGGMVIALEEDPELAAMAATNLSRFGANTTVIRSPVREGHAKAAPYQVVVIEGAVEEVPPALTEQLAEGGRLVTVVRRPAGFGRGTLFLRDRGVVSERAAFDAATPLLPQFARKPSFVF